MLANRRNLVYIAVLAGCFAAGTLAGWTALAARVDHYAYDLMTQMTPVKNAESSSVVVAIDEETLRARGGMRNIRPILTQTLEQIDAAQPKAVALDVILSDKGDDAEDARLEAALHDTQEFNLALRPGGRGVGRSSAALRQCCGGGRPRESGNRPI